MHVETGRGRHLLVHQHNWFPRASGTRRRYPATAVLSGTYCFDPLPLLHLRMAYLPMYPLRLRARTTHYHEAHAEAVCQQSSMLTISPVNSVA